ncbi:MAG: hypothetical protein HC903_30750 [Methylacidiphilales bacterium]|nr:hypothetical protein [Candidatus Methylacidiphilales bacterium]NJR15829.1 hypothetical protein [Calothrix sp. CSU_2_0]
MLASLRITSAIIFFVGAHLILPRIADAAKFNYASRSNYLVTEVDNLITKPVQPESPFSDEYQPPNYGGPDSEHGSGTR